MRSKRNDEWIFWGILLIPLLWAAAALAQAIEQGDGLSGIVSVFSTLLNDPFSVRWCSHTAGCLLAVLVLYPMAVYCHMLDMADRHPGAEHGTAKWGSAAHLNRKYRNRKKPDQNYLLSAHVQFSMNSHAHRHNLNVVVIGGSGAGKTRFYVKPNAMQCACSYLFLDPKGELLRSLGGLYEEMGIPVTVIDLVHFQGHYNPMAYLETDEDAIKLAFAIVNNTKPKDAPASGDKFWDDSSVMLISAIILYLLYEAPVYEQNFSTLMFMIANCQLSENDMEENHRMHSGPCRSRDCQSLPRRMGKWFLNEGRRDDPHMHDRIRDQYGIAQDDLRRRKPYDYHCLSNPDGRCSADPYRHRHGRTCRRIHSKKRSSPDIYGSFVNRHFQHLDHPDEI